ncbi:heat shock protein DnaJ domain protein [Planctopirus limnophila DSM 3776]|uniref:Heat shock protein DnaJ domain protein n=1 Tax=Planctopirus limnophila (strain ATCC 43296 / DSM 3776 / IFAM 1008 / Mu 290) TaxID=521674 RepID=D5SSP4_PLAL2|nr:molecular chaperone DnaJ [Planctopirus limnophila]ADG68845.1 heat shock protein DnaJ domain protein [Planctopirus limnophila DSM 3776]
MGTDAHSLPDDFSKWPENPWELMGMGRSFSSGDLKRVYSKLIKRFRPEIDAEAFQKIRKAYEVLLPYADAKKRSDDFALLLGEQMQTPDMIRPFKDEVILECDSKDAFRGMEASVKDADHSYLSCLDSDPWQLAKSGKVDLAYEVLSRRSLTHPHIEREMLQRYWLLTLQPHLDSSTTSLNLLLSYALKYGLSLQSQRLLTRECSNHPELTTGRDFWKLILDPAFRTLQTQLLRVRWQLYFKRDQDEIVIQEFHRLDEMLVDDCSYWLAIIVCLLEMLIVYEPVQKDELIQHCKSALSEFTVSGFYGDHLLDRADCLLISSEQLSFTNPSIVKASQSVRSLCRMCLKVAFEMEYENETLQNEMVDELLLQLLINPQDTLLCLEILRDKGTIWFQAIKVKIEQLWLSKCGHYIALDGDEIRRHLIRDPVLRSGLKSWHFYYQSLRFRLLRFCLYQQLEYFQVLNVLKDCVPIDSEVIERIDKLSADDPLLCLLRICQIYR